jgi:hypothetical protein
MAPVVLDRQAKFTLFLFCVLAVAFIISSLANELHQSHQPVTEFSTTTTTTSNHNNPSNNQEKSESIKRRPFAVVLHRGGSGSSSTAILKDEETGLITQRRSHFTSHASIHASILAKKLDANFFVISESWPSHLQYILNNHDEILLLDGSARSSVNELFDVSTPTFMEQIKGKQSISSSQVLYLNNEGKIPIGLLLKPSQKATEVLQIWDLDPAKRIDSALECWLETGLVRNE